ncbi:MULTISPECIES: hypothetical protein [unclassified Streptomyces]|uniref:hypothetical protein n=1 Tax=Streptomyces sp. 5-6(2022) TaxID=2936510 RepID=UPI0021E06FB6|nr:MULTISPECIES: hypothetical protein [unclassified Streptomyces]
MADSLEVARRSRLAGWGRAGWEALAEADDVGSGGCQHVLEVSLGQASVAAAAESMSVDGLGGSGLAARADGIAPMPLIGFLFLPGLRLDLLLGLWQKEDVASFAVSTLPVH